MSSLGTPKEKSLLIAVLDCLVSATQAKSRVIRGHTVGHGHGPVALVQIMATMRDIVFDAASHSRQPNGQVVMGTVKQEPCAGCRLGRTGLVTAEHVLAHVLRRVRGMPECFSREHAHGVFAPWALSAGLFAISVALAMRLHGHHLVIDGVERLSGAPVRAVDIRAGAALVVAGLGAEGETVITESHHIDRGYEDFVARMRSIGADIEHG